MSTQEATYTCDRCFAEVKQSNQRGHAWWHAGMQELVHAVERVSTVADADEPEASGLAEQS